MDRRPFERKADKEQIEIDWTHLGCALAGLSPLWAAGVRVD